jgi:hypothetical protein
LFGLKRRADFLRRITLPFPAGMGPGIGVREEKNRGEGKSKTMKFFGVKCKFHKEFHRKSTGFTGVDDPSCGKTSSRRPGKSLYCTGSIIGVTPDLW